MTITQQPATSNRRLAADVNGATRRRRIAITLGASTVATGLMAGLFYAFSCAVMVGLRGTDDRTFIDVMQRINVSIENPVFFAGLLGALALPVVAIVLLHRAGSKAAMRCTLGALCLYVMVLLITAGVNIPLNDQLAKAGDPNRIADPAHVRHQFELVWDVFNALRALLSTTALAFLARALLLQGRHEG